MIGLVFSQLFKAYGEQHWWPADTTFEVMIGAILTQNTSWENVEKAITLLKKEQILTAQAVLDTSHEQLATLIYSSGYYNLKAIRLRRLAQWYVDAGEMQALESLDTVELQRQLLAIKGVGLETANSILLYAFNRAIFIVDTYTRRLFSRLGVIIEGLSTDEAQHMIEISLENDAALFQEYHALIVHHCKIYCLKKPICTGCVLKEQCQY